MFLIQIVDKVFFVFMIMLIARIIGSWVPELRQYKAMQFVSFYADPYLNFFRKVIPSIGMLDISPIFAFLALGFIESLIKSALYYLLSF